MPALELLNHDLTPSLNPNHPIHKIKERVKNTPVAVIIPPSPFLADERVFPFLGAIKVAAELRANGNPVEVLDLSGYGNYEDIVTDFAAKTEAKHFLLTATTPQLPAAARVVERLRADAPGATIGLGGAHVTLTHTGRTIDQNYNRRGRGTMAFEQLEDIFDKLIVGDGEMAAFVAIDPEFPGQTVDAGSRLSPYFMQRGTLDSYKWPARDLIELDSYKYHIDGHRSFSVIAQLGCPFKCGFCGGRDSNVFRVARERSIGDTVAEIEYTIREGEKRGVDYSGVMFYDDELNVKNGHLEDLCGELVALRKRLGKPEMGFRGFVKAELFVKNPRQAELMREAGFNWVLSGIESGSNEILTAMQKMTTNDINSRLVEISHAAGLKVKALMSIGHPGETKATIQESVDWIRRVRPDDSDMTIITPYYGAPYNDHAVYDPETGLWVYTAPNGAKLYSRYTDSIKDAQFYKGVPGSYEAYVSTDELSSDQLVQLRDEAERDIRRELGLPPIQSVAAMQFEHSMGQSLSRKVLRTSYT